MAEPTNAPSASQHEAPTPEALEAILGNAFPMPGDPPRGAAKASEEPEEKRESAPDQASEELTADDIPDDEKAAAQSAADELESIIHNGQEHKLTREEVRKLAQQGFDYTQKAQAVAETNRQLAERIARVAEIEQLSPQVMQDMALVKALEAQLDPYEKADWVTIATNDPLGYQQHKARHDQLLRQHRDASNALGQKMQAVSQRRSQLTAETLQQETVKLKQAIPEWTDPAKFETGRQEVAKYLIAEGAAPEALANVNDALSITIARKAMLYDRLLKAKSEKVKQLRDAPPVVRPGASVPTQSAKANFAKFKEGFKKAGEAGKTNAQEKALTEVFNRTFKI